MARRSARVQAKAESSSAQKKDEEGEPYEDEDDEATEVVVKKRKRTGTSSNIAKVNDGKGKKLRGKRGALQQLTEFPLDVLYEIFGQLRPLDLLHLSRTTKDLRAILLRRSAVGVWKQALSMVPGLPDCPWFIPEPRYTDLMFNAYCHTCSASHVQTIVWPLEARYCQKCITLYFAHIELFNLMSFPHRLLKYAPQLRAVERRTEYAIYHISTLEGLIDEFKHFNESNSHEQDIWEERLEKEHRECSELARKCNDWLQQQASDRACELRSIQEKRRDDIVEKLKKCGWGEELEFGNSLHQLECHALVKQKKALTGRIWSNIEPILVIFMESVKANRLSDLKKSMLKRRLIVIKEIRDNYVSGCPPDAIVPPTADMYFMPPFRSVAENVPYYEEVTSEHFQEAIDQLPQLCQEWREEKDRELLQMIRQASNDETLDESQFQLATTFFNCGVCCSSVPLSYPRVLSHRGAINKSWSKDIEDRTVAEIFTHIHQTAWNSCQQITFYARARTAAAAILEACGFDPSTTTVEEMHAADPIVECSTCFSGVFGHLCMTWRRAVCHHLEKHGTEGCLWKMLDEPLASRMRTRIDEVMMTKMLGDGYNTSWLLRCAHCSTVGNLQQLKNHIVSVHGKTGVTRDDVAQDLDKDYSPPDCRYLDDIWIMR